MTTDLISKFKDIDLSGYPDLSNFNKPLEVSLWILWISKELLNIKMLNAKEISIILRDFKEISLRETSIINSLKRAGDRIYRHTNNHEIYYEIMGSGKEYLMLQQKTEIINLYYFEPNKRYSSKKILSKEIFTNLEGDLKIVDPYCGDRTIDILSSIKNNIKFLTRLENLSQRNKNRLIREIKEYQSEYNNIEFRNYPLKDIHDRYIISSNYLVLLGHSIKDLGSKETFAISLTKESNSNIYQAILENYNRRWKISNVIN